MVPEMGGTARDAAKVGAPHALAVTDTIDASASPRPCPPSPSPAAPRSARRCPSRPGCCRPAPGSRASARVGDRGGLAGLGDVHDAGAGESGCGCGAPGAGGRGSGAVCGGRQPHRARRGGGQEDRELPQVLPAHHQGHGVPFWSTPWDDSGRDGYPPLALVFAKDDVSPDARMNRMTTIRHLSTPCWRGQWHSDPTLGNPKDGEPSLSRPAARTNVRGPTAAGSVPTPSP